MATRYKVVLDTATQTLANKTLTSPVINTPTGIVKGDVGLGNVDNTSNATERAATATLANKTLTSPVFTGTVDGWISADASWTYASASTITVPSGAASLYQKGDKIKWTQTTVKYGVIVEVADTLLTIAVNTDYTVANAVITDNYYSHNENPLGFPARFTFTPNFTGFSSVPTGACQYSVNGGIVSVWINADTSGASNATTFGFTVPIASTSAAYFVGVVFDNGAWTNNPGRGSISGTTASIGTSGAGGAWTGSGNKMWLGQFSYPI